MKWKQAFTLIELLVVIAVIALLMAILIPVLQSVRRYAKAIACQSNLRQWGMAFAIYTNDNQGRFPSNMSGVDGVWLLRGAFISGPNSPQDSFHHFNTRKFICCPMANRPLENSLPSGSSSGGRNTFGFAYRIEVVRGTAFNAWEIRTPAPSFSGSYGLNQWLFNGFHRSFADAVMLRNGRIDLDVLSMRNRTQIPTLLDAIVPWSDPMDMQMPPLYPEGEPAGSVGIQNFCMNRHNGFVNGLFLDWSVRKIGVKELWTLKWYAEFNRAGRWTKAGGMNPQAWPRWMRGFKDY